MCSLSRCCSSYKMARYGRLLSKTLMCELISPWRIPAPASSSHSCFSPSSSPSRTLCTETFEPLGESVSECSRASSSVSTESTELSARKVAVFWDLDNKPPKQVPPYDAAMRLIDMAAGFGEVVDVAAYANRYAFSYLPYWVKEQRKERKELDKLETAGVIERSEPYVCGYCGRKCKTNEKLKKHFRDLHERERNKRMNRMESLKGSRRLKYKASLSEKEERYRNAARKVLLPKVGYGLAGELRRAGVYVRMVSDKPQAADEALKLHMNRSIRQGVDCICLVSDDSDFSSILKSAQSKELHTVIIGDTPTLRKFADVKFSWQDVASGIALALANEIQGQWSREDGLYQDDFEDSYEQRRGRAGNSAQVKYDELSDVEDFFEGEEELFSTSSEEEDEQQEDCFSGDWIASRRRPKKLLTTKDFWWLSALEDEFVELKEPESCR